MVNLRKQLGTSEIILIALVAAYVALWPFESSAAVILGIRQILQGLIYILGGLVLMRWLIKGWQWATRMFLWRVRHRMIAVFFFVGALPVTLGVLLVAYGMILLFGPLAAYMVTSQLSRQAQSLYSTADSVRIQLESLPSGEHLEFVEGFHRSLAGRFPNLAMYSNVAGAETIVPPGAVKLPIPTNLATHEGPVNRGEVSYMTAVSTSNNGGSVVLVVPMTPEYLRRMLPGLGFLAPDFDVADSAQTGLRDQMRGVREGDDIETIVDLPPPTHPFDWRVVWPIQSQVLDWDADEVRSGIFILQTRLSAVSRMIFASQSEPLNRLAVLFGYGLFGAFAATVLVSLIVAVSLTRTLTRAVNELYVGTQHVNAGNFGYRVPTVGVDQISDLSRSFNTMTASIERLVEDSKERERLESELSIAREVQARLFPAEPPETEFLEMLGVCRPAQSVSGDFFDYVKLSETRVAMSFGDVAGKGISAALVMASLHSVVRTQLSVLGQDGGAHIDKATAELVARANRQLCNDTSPEKFSTLFFGAYDHATERLAYSNAGHLPPLLIRNGEVHPLDINGMVVGAFSHAPYDASSLEFKQGDLFVAFTDGVTEPENAYEQEFGEARLQEILLRESNRPIDEIIATVMGEVIEWTGDPTLQDDMTMLVARRL